MNLVHLAVVTERVPRLRPPTLYMACLQIAKEVIAGRRPELPDAQRLQELGSGVAGAEGFLDLVQRSWAQQPQVGHHGASNMLRTRR